MANTMNEEFLTYYHPGGKALHDIAKHLRWCGEAIEDLRFTSFAYLKIAPDNKAAFFYNKYGTAVASLDFRDFVRLSDIQALSSLCNSLSINCESLSSWCQDLSKLSDDHCELSTQCSELSTQTSQLNDNCQSLSSWCGTLSIQTSCLSSSCSSLSSSCSSLSCVCNQLSIQNNELCIMCQTFSGDMSELQNALTKINSRLRQLEDAVVVLNYRVNNLSCCCCCCKKQDDDNNYPSFGIVMR